MSSLLNEFIGSRVMVVTNMVDNTVDLGEGVTMPKVMYAELLDIDDSFIYLGDKGIPIIMLSLGEVIMIERDPVGNFEVADEVDELLNSFEGDGTFN